MLPRASLSPYISLSLPCGEQKGQNLPVKYWETVADKQSKAGWSWGCVSAVDSLFFPLSMKRPANIAGDRKGPVG